MPHSVAVPAFTPQSFTIRVAEGRLHRCAQNDNGSALPEPDPQSDELLAAALQCLSDHGLRAAREAYDQAESAFEAGEHAQCDWWVGVCRMLDRRMASGLCKRLEARIAL